MFKSNQSKTVCWSSTKQRSTETKLGLKSEMLLKYGKYIHDDIISLRGET